MSDAMNLAPTIRQRFFDNSGLPLAGGQLYTYAAGTTTPQATYSDGVGTANANPVVMDAYGYCDLWLDWTLSYKFVLQDANNNTLWTKDSVIWTPAALSTPLTGYSATTGEITSSDTILSAFEKTTGNMQQRCYNAKTDFGAKGDGVTDDTTALQAMLTAAKTSLYPMYLPPGNYLVSSTLDIDFVGAILFGAGMENTSITQSNASLGAATLQTDSSIDRQWNLHFSDFSVVQPNAATGDGILINNPNHRCVLERLYVGAAPGNSSSGIGIHIYRTSGASSPPVDGYYTTIYDCFVEKMAEGIRIEGQSPGGANLHWINKTTTSSCTTYGIHTLNCSSIRIDSCDLEQNGTGIYAENSPDIMVCGGTYFESNNNYDIQLVSGDAAKFIGNRHNGSGVGNASGRSILIETAAFVEITGNTFFQGYTSYDVETQSGSLGTLIMNNTCQLQDGSWESSGPRILDNGTGTMALNPQQTTGGTYQYNFAIGSYLCNGFTLVNPAIQLSYGTSGSNPQIYSGSQSPNTSSGLTAVTGSIFLRTGSFNYLYYLNSSSATDWRQVWGFNDTAVSWTPGAISAGDTVELSVTVPVAGLGDFVNCSFNVVTGGLILFGEVITTNTVAARLYNPTGSTITLGAGTLTVRVSQA